jgi:hypothetical protein
MPIFVRILFVLFAMLTESKENEMSMINVISKKEEGERMNVHLKSGFRIKGYFKKVEDGLLKMTNVDVIQLDCTYSSPRATVLIDAVEMCLPWEE